MPARMNAGRVLLALTGALLAWAFFFGGGDSSSRLTWIGSGAALLAAFVTAAAFDRRIGSPRVSRFGIAAAACFAALVVWQGISIVWSVQPDRSWDYVNRGLAYLAFFVLGMFVGALVPRAPRAAATGLAALLALVLGYALLAKGIPALYPDYGRLARLRSPVGFWNALALLGDFALVLGLWRAAQRRFDGVPLVFAAVLTVLLAYSRGGVAIPGARGCSTEACDFRDHFADLQAAGAAHVWGLSSQDPEYQAEVVERLRLPFRMLSDPQFALADALTLPTFSAPGHDRLYSRLTLVVSGGKIDHVFYPIFPPNTHAQQVLDWLQTNPT
jgi:peroxiredoxin